MCWNNCKIQTNRDEKRKNIGIKERKIEIYWKIIKNKLFTNSDICAISGL